VPPVKNIVRNQWCTESRTWPGSEDERAQFEVKKCELLDAAVCCVQYVLVSLAREVEASKLESLTVAPRALRGLPDSRKHELMRFLAVDADVLRDDESAGVTKTPRWWRKTGRRGIVTRYACSTNPPLQTTKRMY
jgi:hypothetical protein